MASSTSRSTLFFADRLVAELMSSGAEDSPLTTSRSLTHRHNAPSFGFSPLMRISARRIRASIYFPSANAADIRAVRILPAVRSLESVQLRREHKYLTS